MRKQVTPEEDHCGVAVPIIDKEQNMEITWKYIKPLKDDSSVKSFLNEHGISLPAPLVALLEKNNGGRPSEKIIKTKNKREYVFKSLLSYNPDDLECIYRIYDESFEDKQVYPLGFDAAGNMVCYDLANSEYCLYNHETDLLEPILEIPFV